MQFVSRGGKRFYHHTPKAPGKWQVDYINSCLVILIEVNKKAAF